MRLARIEGQALGFQARFLQSLGILFLAAIYLTLARSVIFGIPGGSAETPRKADGITTTPSVRRFR